MLKLIGRRYDTAQPLTITIAGQRIADVSPLADLPASAANRWIAPGFVDLQVNGFASVEFASDQLTTDDVRAVSLSLDSHGVTSYCPTVTTQSFEVLAHSFTTLAEACDELPEVAQRVAGFHLEGPYISSEDGPRGAHPRVHCRAPDWDEFQQFQAAAGGRIRILTLSPEYDGSAAFIQRVVASGVAVAIGHTAANSDQIRAAADAGATMSTHLGNGAHGTLRRHPNYLWDQLADDRLVASLIADGHHLPGEVLQTFVRAKTAERIVLVSDVTSMAGLPAGVYPETSLGNVEVLPGGRLVIAGQTQMLAGAALPIGVGVINIMRHAGVALAEAIEMASRRPAQLIHQTPVAIEVDSPADLILFELSPVDEQTSQTELHVITTLNGGQTVFTAD